jgi:hypothetical protein
MSLLHLPLRLRGREPYGMVWYGTIPYQSGMVVPYHRMYRIDDASRAARDWTVIRMVWFCGT